MRKPEWAHKATTNSSCKNSLWWSICLDIWSVGANWINHAHIRSFIGVASTVCATCLPASLSRGCACKMFVSFFFPFSSSSSSSTTFRFNRWHVIIIDVIVVVTLPSTGDYEFLMQMHWKYDGIDAAHEIYMSRVTEALNRGEIGIHAVRYPTSMNFANARKTKADFYPNVNSHRAFDLWLSRSLTRSNQIASRAEPIVQASNWSKVFAMCHLGA